MDRYVTDIKNGCYQNPVLPMDFSDPRTPSAWGRTIT